VLRTLKALGYTTKTSLYGLFYLQTKKMVCAGVTKYTEEAKAKNEKHVFALESDAGGFTPRGLVLM
jgi:hypothetical protein